MNIVDQVRQTVAVALNLPIESVSAESSQDNLDVWDSLAQINLVMALEQDFDIQLDVEEFMEMDSVVSIVKHLEECVPA